MHTLCRALLTAEACVAFVLPLLDLFNLIARHASARDTCHIGVLAMGLRLHYMSKLTGIASTDRDHQDEGFTRYMLTSYSCRIICRYTEDTTKQCGCRAPDQKSCVVQDNGLVPIVEPEMTLGAGDYSIEDTSYWSERVLTHVFRHLNQHDVMLEGILMKPSMCLPGDLAAH